MGGGALLTQSLLEELLTRTCLFMPLGRAAPESPKSTNKTLTRRRTSVKSGRTCSDSDQIRGLISEQNCYGEEPWRPGDEMKFSSIQENKEDTAHRPEGNETRSVCVCALCIDLMSIKHEFRLENRNCLSLIINCNT